MSQADSEEEWKVLPSSSSTERSTEGSPRLTGANKTPVFIAGGRVSAVCVCVCACVFVCVRGGSE